MSKLIGPDLHNAGSDTPKIAFPCDYPIKVLGRSHVSFRADVIAVVLEHDPHFDPASISQRESRRGAFHALTLTIRATGVAQLEALHAALQRIDAVKMVL
ncbi:MAG: DUF493 domain-containing protein [Pseudomonadales bacterium]